LAIALLVAALTDLKRRQITNRLNAAVAAIAPIYWIMGGLSLTQIAWQVGVAVAVLAITTIFFARGAMGGGDVKLLVALALWFPPLAYFQLIFMMSIVGGAMSMIAGARNLTLEPDQTVLRLLAGAGTALWLVLSAYVVAVLNGGTPLDLAAAARAVIPGWLGTVLIYGGLAAAFAVLLSGALIVARKQKSKLPIPYGLAISIAGLWVLVTQFLPPIAWTGLGSGLG
jgi:prepilin peptidase CpaA